MTRARFTWAALLLAVSIPASAAQYAMQWSLFSGRVDENCQTVNQTERLNRNINAARIFDAAFLPVEVKPDGSFNPNDTNVLLQCGWTYDEYASMAETVGMPVIVNYIQEAFGAPNGPGYHESRPPVLSPAANRSTAVAVQDWLHRSHPDLVVLVWIPGNESTFDRTNTYTHEKWWAAWQAIAEVAPASWESWSAGTSGREFRNGSLTLNGWLASTGRAAEHGIKGNVHCNGKSDGQCRSELEELRDRYGMQMVMGEDRPPSNSSNRAKDRAQLCVRSGASWCTAFGPRDSGNPPLGGCEWGVNHPLPNRDHVGLEGCGREVRIGRDGLPNNIRKARQASVWMGAFEGEGPLLPWDVGTGQPPPPPEDPDYQAYRPLAHLMRRQMELEREAQGGNYALPSVDDMVADSKWRKRALNAGLVTP